MAKHSSDSAIPCVRQGSHGQLFAGSEEAFWKYTEIQETTRTDLEHRFPDQFVH